MIFKIGYNEPREKEKEITFALELQSDGSIILLANGYIVLHIYNDGRFVHKLGLLQGGLGKWVQSRY